MKPHLEEARRALKLADRDIAAFRVLAASTAVRSTRSKQTQYGMADEDDSI